MLTLTEKYIGISVEKYTTFNARLIIFFVVKKNIQTILELQNCLNVGALVLLFISFA